MFERFINSKEYLYLPISKRRYKLNINGLLLTDENKAIKPELNENGEYDVTLDWIDGVRKYKLSNLIAHTFKPVKLVYRYWNSLSVLYADGNKLNLHPANLVWKFPVALSFNESNGFCFIPMFSRYMINIDGEVFDTFRQKLQNSYCNKGYFSYSLMPDLGPRATLKKHRAMCLVFKDYPHNVDRLQVNHIDGNVSNNNLNNLEWVTGSENMLHAISNNLTKHNKPVVVTNLVDNKITEFNTLVSVCKTFGLNESKVSSELSSNRLSFIFGDFIIKYKYSKHAILKNTNNVPILVKNIKDDSVTRYKSINECSDKTGISKDIIQYRLKNKSRFVYDDALMFKREEDTTPWYKTVNFDDELLISNWNKAILIKDLINGNITEFISQREVSRYLNIAESTVTQRLSAKQKIYRDDIRDSYILIKEKSDISKWRVIENPVKEYNDSLISKVVLVKDIITDTVSSFNSAKECAVYFGLLETTLNWRLKSKGQKIYSSRYMFKYSNEKTPFK